MVGLPFGRKLIGESRYFKSREQFVVDALEVIGTDPTYSDPYNP